MSESKPYLPRDLGTRIALGTVSLFFGYLWGGAVLIMLRIPWGQFGMLGDVILGTVEEMLIVATLAMILLFIWAVAMPTWVENLFRWAWKKLHFTILIALVAGLVFIFCAFLWNNTFEQ